MDDVLGEEVRDAADAVGMLLSRAPTLPNVHGPLRLEVHHVWGNSVLASKVFTRDDRVCVGTDTGDRWSFLGVDMGFVPRPLALALRAVPLWTEHERTWRCDFVVPADDLPGGRTHELVALHDGVQVLNVPPGAEVYLTSGDPEPTPDGGSRVPLVPGLGFAVRIGGATLVGGLAPAAARVAPPRMDRDDLPVVGLLGAGMALAAAVAVTLGLAGPPERGVAVAEIPEDYVVMLLDAPPPPAPPDEGARAAKGAEGKRGPKDPKRSEVAGDRPLRRRDHDKRVAENAGVLGAMGGELDEVLGSASLSDGLVSGVRGLVGVAGVGSDGLGGRGDHLGGGGDAEGLGSFVVGDGTGRTGPGIPQERKRDGEIGAVIGDPIVLGTLQASEIDEVVKRHMQQIRYCYQRELQKRPGLGGKVVLKFTIASDGSVSSAAPRTSTLDGEAVESCLVGRFQHMQFPEPRGGGVVVVSYPLLFSAG